MAVNVQGFRRHDAETIRRWCEQALDHLGIEANIEVTPLRNAPPGAEGQGGENGLGLASHILPSAIGKDPLQRLRLGFIIYEEVAHIVLGEAEVPHEGLGAFFQELYGGWAQYSAFVATGRISGRDMTSTPLGHYPSMYELGKHVGAEMGGSPASRAHLEEWFNDPASQQEAVELVDIVRDRLTPPLEPEDVADLYDEIQPWFGGLGLAAT